MLRRLDAGAKVHAFLVANIARLLVVTIVQTRPEGDVDIVIAVLGSILLDLSRRQENDGAHREILPHLLTTAWGDVAGFPARLAGNIDHLRLGYNATCDLGRTSDAGRGGFALRSRPSMSTRSLERGREEELASEAGGKDLRVTGVESERRAEDTSQVDTTPKAASDVDGSGSFQRAKR